MTQPFFAIVMPWGRVGSNLVLDVLVEHTNVGVANEPTTALRTPYERGDDKTELFHADQVQLEYLAAFPDVAGFPMRLPAGRDLRGVKLSHRSLVSPMSAYALLAEKGFRIIVMDRANHIKSAISQMRADQRAVWSVRRGEEVPGPMRIGPIIALSRARYFASASSQLKDYLGHFFPEGWKTVQYETLNADPEGTIRDIAAYIGVTLPRRFTLPHQKATTDDLSQSVSNWDEVRAVFADSEFAPLLDD